MSKHLLLLDEIACILGEAATLQEVLDRVVGLVAERMETDACSIWLLDATGNLLTLAATRGLSVKGVGQARLKKGVGLTWQPLLRQAPVATAEAPGDPHYVDIPILRETEFHSFLGVPLQVRSMGIGTLCVHTIEARAFAQDEVRALSAIASQIAPVVENARLLSLVGQEDRVAEPQATLVPHARVQGTPCSNGIVAGPLLRLDGETLPVAPRRGSRRVEARRLQEACEQARAELLRMQEFLRERNAEEAALVFSVQLMLLEDPSFLGRMRAAVRKGQSACEAIETVAEDTATRFAKLSSTYFRERAEDLRDLAARLMRQVRAGEHGAGADLEGKVAVVPRLAPSRLVSLRAGGVAAVLAGGGGATSHAALLARSLDLPLVVGLGDFVNRVHNGQQVLVDAASGEVVLDPPPAMVEAATRAAAAGVQALHRLEGPGSGRILFEANVSLWGDAVRAREHDAEGIGLYRTEFAFFMRPDLPGEEEQYVLYRRVVEEVAPRPVTFRFLDAGGDKLVPALNATPEPNPFLGYRSLRLLLDNPDILAAQARAILRALEGTQGRLLVPMVASVEELRAVRSLLLREVATLPPLGAMIELPSALLEIDEIAAEADFVSIGTNDLTQHLLGVDRTNARVSRYFDPCQPAVIRAIHHVAQATHRAGKALCVCGEAASNPLLLPLWLGIGVRRLSVHATRLRVLRGLEARLDEATSREVAAELVRLDSSAAIRDRLERLAAPEVLEFVAVRRGR